MAGQKRVAAGVPAGGEFAAQDRPEATLSLEAELADADRALQRAVERKTLAQMALIARNTLDKYPTAHEVQLYLNDETLVLTPTEIRDADGKVLDENGFWFLPSMGLLEEDEDGFGPIIYDRQGTPPTTWVVGARLLIPRVLAGRFGFYDRLELRKAQAQGPTGTVQTRIRGNDMMVPAALCVEHYLTHRGAVREDTIWKATPADSPMPCARCQFIESEAAR